MEKVTLTYFTFITMTVIAVVGSSSTAGSINTVPDAVHYGGWRTWEQLAQISNEDKRNTLIVEMNGHSSLTIPQLQGKASNGRINSLVGMAAICIYLRDMQIRSIDQLKQMSDHDQRNTLIVELHKRLNSPVPFLQSKGDLELVRMGRSINSVADVVHYGGWRTWEQLAQYSNEDKRNTLIVEMNKHSSLTIKQLQGKASNGRINSLVGMAAICIYVRDMQFRSIDQLKQMSDHDQRNTLIVELHKRLNYTVPFLQSKGDLELVRLGISRL